MRSVGLLNKADDERLAALEKYEDEMTNLRNTLAKESGEELGSITERVALKFKDTIAKMTAQGDKELLAKFLGVEEAKMALEDLSLTYQRVQTQIQNRLSIVTNVQESGVEGPTKKTLTKEEQDAIDKAKSEGKLVYLREYKID